MKVKWQHHFMRDAATPGGEQRRDWKWLYGDVQGYVHDGHQTLAVVLESGGTELLAVSLDELVVIPLDPKQVVAPPT